MPRSVEYQKITAITAATHTVLPGDHTTLFTNRGGGALTLTLPAIADVQAGWWIEVFLVADGAHVLTAPANKLTGHNNATGTTLTIATATEMIGNKYKVEFDGTTYLVMPNWAAEAVTSVIA